MWCHEFKGVTYYHPHLSRFVRINYTNLFKQALHYSSENMVSSQSRNTPNLQPIKCVEVERGGGVGACAGVQARKAQANTPKHCACSGAKLTAFQRGKTHILATPEVLLFSSPPRALVTRGDATWQACPHLAKCDYFHRYHLHRPTWLPARFGQDPKPGKAGSTLHISFSIQVSENTVSLNCCDAQ